MNVAGRSETAKKGREKLGTWTEDIVLALSNLGGVGTLSEIYKEVRNVRTGSIPVAIEATIRGAIERNSSDSLAHSGKNDIFFSVKGLGAGIWGLRSFAAANPVANDADLLPSGTAEPARHAQVTYRILRETEMARKIKLLHKNTCQMCGLMLTVAGRAYSEAHHLKPLGKPHSGPDIPSNIIIACPNCHVRLDYFSIHVDLGKLIAVGGHAIGTEFVEYHNSQLKSAVQTDVACATV